jgi:hypothetical protein
MDLIYSAWPFQIIEKRSDEEMEQWLAHCYLPGAADTILQSRTHPLRIVAGGPGSGKSALIQAVEQREREYALMIPYRADRWPKARHARPGGNHLVQIMSLAGPAIRKHLTANPEQIKILSKMQREFLRWLSDKYGTMRTFASWVDGLPAGGEALADVEYRDLYPTTTDLLDAQGQVDELTNLIRKLGYERTLIIVDFNSHQAKSHMQNLVELFEWFGAVHVPTFALVAALPISIVKEANLVAKAGGGVSIVYLEWPAEQMWEMALRHIRQATGNTELDWKVIATDPVLAEMEKVLLAEYGDYAPAGWVALAETLLYLAVQPGTHPLPWQIEDVPAITHALFARHLPLRLDPAGHGVWRGPKYIELTEQRYRFLEALQRRGGQPLFTDDDLIDVAGTKGNIHSLASRIRALIEPLADEPVYLMNKRSAGGYWLEHCEPFLTGS